MSKPDMNDLPGRGLFLAAMGEEGFRSLFEGARPVEYASGRTIFAAGEEGSSVLLVEQGRVEVSVTTVSGRKSVLAHLGPGDVLGEIAALDGGERSADTVAATPVKGLILSRENVLNFVSERPDIARALIVELCRKVRNASDMFLTQSALKGEPRLARGLLRLFEKWGAEANDGTALLVENFSQHEIGEFSGLARENVNRQIKAWTDAGILRLEGRTLVLLDRGALEDLAEA